jgi:hypothetical protein
LLHTGQLLGLPTTKTGQKRIEKIDYFEQGTGLVNTLGDLYLKNKVRKRIF